MSASDIENAPAATNYGDLASCNAEPLRAMGSVQNRGCLLCFSIENKRIESLSTNTKAVLGLDPKTLLGARIDEFFSAEFISQVHHYVSNSSNVAPSGVDLECEREGQAFAVSLFASEGLFCLEFEKSTYDLDALQTRRKVERTVTDYLVSSKLAMTTESLAGEACRAIREITGMDRVMMYHFLQPSWDGVVIAEDRVMQAHSYMLHHFPASDIPKQARDLYLQNGVRVISDVEAGDSPLQPDFNPLTKRPIDLSDSRLRSVSPIHVEYLRNMGVRSSLSAAVIVKGELWGLIACHNVSRGLVLTAAARRGCEMVANAFAGQIQLLQMNLQQSQVAAFEARSKILCREIGAGPDPIDLIFRKHQLVQEMFNSGGMAFVSADDARVDFAGLTPPRAMVSELARELRERMKSEGVETFVTSSLSELHSNWKALSNIACGVLAVQISDKRDMLLLFRIESIKTVNWGGDPRKLLAKKGFSGRINPRLSFETWEQVIRDQSRAWEPFEIAGAEFIRDYIGILLQKGSRST